MSAEACLADFLKKTPNGISIVAGFTGVTEDSVHRWKEGTSPYGERFVRLIVLLKLVGYTVAELEKIDSMMQSAAEYIALGVISINDLASKTGLDEGRRIFRYINGEHGMSADRGEKLKVALAEKSTDFEKKKAETLLKFSEICLTTSKDVPGGPDQLIESFTSACEAVRTLGRQLLASDRSIRFDMRTKIGSGREPLLQTTWETLNLLLYEHNELKH